MINIDNEVKNNLKIINLRKYTQKKSVFGRFVQNVFAVIISLKLEENIMADCSPEFWTLKDIRDSLEKEWNGKKKIVIPMFQRGKRWDKDKKATFIDSLRKRYPIGTLLFYKTVDGKQEVYTLIDGLQRGNAIREYLSTPSKFFSLSELSEAAINKTYSLIICGGNAEVQKEKINELISSYVRGLNKYDNLELFELYEILRTEFPILNERNKEFGNALKDDFRALKDNYNYLCQMTIPAIVYTGDENTLPEIFERINSKGVPLTEYEIYAASWPRQEFAISNDEIVESVLRKYDMLNDSEFTIGGYDRDAKRKSRKVNIFEYVFGLSKYLQKKYFSLCFNEGLKDDETNPVAFQILNACFNSSHSQIKDVYKIVEKFANNIDILEKSLISSIEFIEKCIEPISKFKGNNRNGKSKIFHSQFQIMSLISFAFRKKHDVYDSNLKVNNGWKENKVKLQNNIWKYYIYDIVTKYWGEGGTSKIHAANSENRYFEELSTNTFSLAFDSYSESLLNRQESKLVLNPSVIDYVILNAIYVKSFSAMDQLSVDKFDVEHIATKEQMKKLISKCKGAGLPISHIANLCYLPEYENRSKGSKNFYQDTLYLDKSKINIKFIEERYSFTDKEDLEFMDLEYDERDFDVLKEYYVNEFLKKRTRIIKDKFMDSLGFLAPQADEPVPNTTDATTFSDKYFRMTKIGKLVKFTFEYLINNKKISDEDIVNLKNRIFCSTQLKFPLPIFVDNENETYDPNGIKRYYQEPLYHNDKPIFLCREWHEYHRKTITTWFKSKIL